MNSFAKEIYENSDFIYRLLAFSELDVGADGFVTTIDETVLQYLIRYSMLHEENGVYRAHPWFKKKKQLLHTEMISSDIDYSKNLVSPALALRIERKEREAAQKKARISGLIDSMRAADNINLKGLIREWYE